MFIPLWDTGKSVVLFFFRFVSDSIKQECQTFWEVGHIESHNILWGMEHSNIYISITKKID
jgi:hypothetical protein